MHIKTALTHRSIQQNIEPGNKPTHIHGQLTYDERSQEYMRGRDNLLNK